MDSYQQRRWSWTMLGSLATLIGCGGAGEDENGTAAARRALNASSASSTASAPGPGGMPGTRSPAGALPKYIPGELIVKFRDTAPVGAVAEELSARSQPFADVTDTAALDELNRRHGAARFRRIVRRQGSPTRTTRGRISRALAESLNASDQQQHAAQGAKRRAGAGQPRYLGNMYRVRLSDPQADVEQLAAAYAGEPNVEYAHPNYLMPTSQAQTRVPDDPLYPEQWAHQRTDIEAAWHHQTGSSEVVIAIVDTGVDYDHEDLSAKIWKDAQGNPGRDFVDVDPTVFTDAGYSVYAGEDYQTPDNEPTDFHSHGTHCAGIAAAATDNATGVAGVAWGSRIMPIRAGFTIGAAGIPKGAVDTAATVAGIDYAVTNGADVISMSFGGFAKNQALSNALQNAHSHGVVLVAAAGNMATGARSYPAAEDHVISVAATAADDTRASYSNFGWWIDVAAPGGDKSADKDTGIVSTVPRTGAPFLADESGYNYFNGTSMAAPYVAGVAALVLSEYPEATPEDVAARIMATADPPSGQHAGMLGAGRVNVLGALTSSPAPFLKVSEVEIVELTGNGNGIPESNETMGVRVGVSNVWAGAGAASVELVSADSHVVLGQADWSLGAIAGGESRENANQPFTLQLSSVQRDSNLSLGLKLTADGETRTVPLSPPVGVRAMTAGIDIEWNAVLSDKYVAFLRFDDFENEINIYAVDLSTGQEQRITHVPEYTYTQVVGPADLALDRDHLVWVDNRAGGADVYVYDFATGQEQVVASGPGAQRGPDVFGENVVWEQEVCPEGVPYGDRDLCESDIHLTNLQTGESRPICTAPGKQSSPMISGDKVAWTDERNGSEDIYLYDLAAGTEQPLVVRERGQRVRDLSGDILLYTDCLMGGCQIVVGDDPHSIDHYDAYYIDLSTGVEMQVTDAPGWQTSMSVSGRQIVWTDERNGQSDIYLLNLDTQEETRLTQNQASQSHPDIQGNRIVWEDQRYASGIFLTEVGPRLGDVNYNSQIDIVDALSVARYSVGLDTPGFHPEVADVNCNGSIDSVDALLIARYYVGLIERLPCEPE
jgi:thermitase